MVVEDCASEMKGAEDPVGHPKCTGSATDDEAVSTAATIGMRLLMPHRAICCTCFAFALIVGVACGGGDDPVSPARNSVVGHYVATSLTTNTLGITTNELATGSAVSLTLREGGTATGDIYIASFEHREVFQGTWKLERDVVELDSPTDGLLRDVDLTVRGNTLVGDRWLGVTRIHLTLTKQ